MERDEVESTAAEYIRTAVARGRDTCGEIVANTVEYLHGYGEPDELRALAWQHIGPAFAQHLDAQATWPERTDSDRLTDAFRALDAAGIVAREDFACCQNCGVTEIGAEVLDTAPARGYVFYHQQDTERAAAGGSLWLAYGLFNQPPSAEIGEEIAAALRAEGLHVDWNGSPGQRIHVRLDWARRRHGRLAAFVADPAGPEATVEVTSGQRHLEPRMSTTVLTRLELPWLPTGVSVKIEEAGRSTIVRRDHHRLVSDDGRAASRFDGLRLLAGDTVAVVPDEPGILDVTFEHGRSGASEPTGRPMVLPEVLDVLRRLPTRTDSWLSTSSGTGGIVQLRWENGRLWLETPNPEEGTSTGKYASLDEAVQMLTILAAEDRVAIGDLDGVTTKPW